MQKIDGSQLISEITLDDLQKAVGGSISFCACAHKLRKMSGFSFVILRTGRYILQSVYSKDKCTGDFDSLCEGAYIKITGDVKEEKRANHGYEITLSSFEILSKPAEEYPLHVSSKKLGCSIETSMAHRSVALRHPEQRAVFKISEGVVSAFREFMLNNNFTEIHSPKIVAAGAEGGANIFKLKYFDKDAYLAQSPQFYKQTCVAFFDRVFEIAPVYRAEKHNSTRHLNEYIGLDFEMGFINDMHDVMAMETAMLKYVVEYLPKHYSDELELLGATFVEKFPGLKRPFYAMDSADDPKLAESFDLLFRGLEITTGGQRIHDYNELLEKMKRYHMEEGDLGAYTDIFKYGMPPHGGLGIGLERVVMKMLGLANIREASLFPRDIHHLDP